jgi:hypothetical protein
MGRPLPDGFFGRDEHWHRALSRFAAFARLYMDRE